jgi:hypothetical protein
MNKNEYINENIDEPMDKDEYINDDINAINEAQKLFYANFSPEPPKISIKQ